MRISNPDTYMNFSFPLLLRPWIQWEKWYSRIAISPKKNKSSRMWSNAIIESNYYNKQASKITQATKITNTYHLPDHHVHRHQIQHQPPHNPSSKPQDPRGLQRIHLSLCPLNITSNQICGQCEKTPWPHKLSSISRTQLLHLREITTWNNSWRLVIDTALESNLTPINELNGS